MNNDIAHTGGIVPLPEDEGHGRGPAAIVTTEVAQVQQEIMAAVLAAKRMPRDENGAIARIEKACERESLAELAEYAYPRGKKPDGTPNIVSGPSVDLILEVAAKWGNLRYGWREVVRGPDFSDLEAFCWDLEGNTRKAIAFRVPHYRETKRGNIRLTVNRDIYELLSNQAARRERKCIEDTMPGDVTERALERCRETLLASAMKDLPQRLAKMTQAFHGSFGVSKEMLEKHVGKTMDKFTGHDLIALRRVFKGIKDGEMTVEAIFGAAAGAAEEAKDSSSAVAAELEKRGQAAAPPPQGEGVNAAPPQAPPDATAAPLVSPPPAPAGSSGGAPAQSPPPGSARSAAQPTPPAAAPAQTAPGGGAGKPGEHPPFPALTQQETRESNKGHAFADAINKLRAAWALLPRNPEALAETHKANIGEWRGYLTEQELQMFSKLRKRLWVEAAAAGYPQPDVN